MIYIVALLTLQARFDVSKLKRPTMADVNTSPGDTRKHTQTVVFWARCITKVSDVGTVSLPFILPFFLNFRRIIAFHICNYSTKIAPHESEAIDRQRKASYASSASLAELVEVLVFGTKLDSGLDWSFFITSFKSFASDGASTFLASPYMTPVSRETLLP